MRVSELLDDKGDLVVTVHPDTSLEQAAKQLARYGFGVLVASEDGKVVSGILSERDIVRKIAEVGAPGLKVKTRSIMTRKVHTCTPDHTVDDLMRLMTEHRFRHVPVVDEEEHVCGLVSMSDLVKRRVTELEAEAEMLQNMITSR
ncbi:MAG: CBS domain-containing protein [Acidimicrobiales bacterium]